MSVFCPMHRRAALAACAIPLMAAATATPAFAQFGLPNLKKLAGNAVGGELSGSARDKLDKFINPLGNTRMPAEYAASPLHPALERDASIAISRIDSTNHEVTKYYQMFRPEDKRHPEMVAAMAKVEVVIAWRNKVASALNGPRLDPKVPILPAPTDWQVKVAPGAQDPFLAIPGSDQFVKGCVVDKENPIVWADAAYITAQEIADEAARKEALRVRLEYRRYVMRQLWGIPGYGTYADLAKQADAAAADIEKTFPTASSLDSKSAAAITAGYEASMKKVADAAAFRDKLSSVSYCVHRAGKWNDLASMDIRTRIADHAAPLVDKVDDPCDHIDDISAESLTYNPKKTWGESYTQFGELLQKWKQAKKVEPFIAALPIWSQFMAKNFGFLKFGKDGAESSKYINGCIDAYNRIQSEGGPTLVSIVKGGGVPKSWISSTGGNAKILTGLLEKKPIAAYGVEWGPFEESKTVVEVKGVKVLALFKSKEFGAMAVYPNEDPDLPQITGMPNKICSVWSGIVKVYAKGVDVPLNTNLLRRWDNFGPMDCANIQKPSIFKD